MDTNKIGTIMAKMGLIIIIGVFIVGVWGVVTYPECSEGEMVEKLEEDDKIYLECRIKAEQEEEKKVIDGMIETTTKNITEEKVWLEEHKITGLAKKSKRHLFIGAALIGAILFFVGSLIYREEERETEIYY